MDTLYQKIITAVLSVILSFTIGSIPVWLAYKVSVISTLTQYNKLRTVLSLLSCLSAGVFLGTCLLELFPEVDISLIEASQAYGIATNFPIAQFVTAVGLFIVLTIETLLFSFHGVFENKKTQKLLLNQSVSGYGSVSEEAISDLPNTPQQTDVFGDQIEFRPSRLSFSLSGKAGEKPFRAFILFIALSLHTFLEGLSCGLEKSPDLFWQYAIALCIHKPLLSIGINISYLRTTWGSVKFVSLINFIFSAMSALGITIGLIGVLYVEFDLNAVQIVTGILQGLASGTFLYVVFIDILPFEMASHAEGYRRLSNLFALAFGFGITAAMVIFHHSNEALCSNS